jgi:CRISPR-associated protein Csx17
MNQPLNVSAFHGINNDCLGHYLIGLGLLRAVSSKWPEARGCWHDGRFHLVAPLMETDVTDFIAQTWQPTPYEKWWEAAQREDRGKVALHTWQARSCEKIDRVRVSDCTLFTVARNCSSLWKWGKHR